jgi:hypothetical protein
MGHFLHERVLRGSDNYCGSVPVLWNDFKELLVTTTIRKYTYREANTFEGLSVADLRLRVVERALLEYDA